jgi:hypothetical protein
MVENMQKNLMFIIHFEEHITTFVCISCNEVGFSTPLTFVSILCCDWIDGKNFANFP